MKPCRRQREKSYIPTYLNVQQKGVDYSLNGREVKKMGITFIGPVGVLTEKEGGEKDKRYKLTVCGGKGKDLSGVK